MDDLTTLGVGPSDRKKLESMGFTTLEQIALMRRHGLGMGKQKGDALIQRARNILANRNIDVIEVNSDIVIVKLKHINDSIIVSVKDLLSVWSDDNQNVECIENTMQITQKVHSFNGITDDWERRNIEDENKQAIHYFEQVKNNAKQWIAILEAKKKNDLAKKGIDLDRQRIIDFAKERGFDGFWHNVFEEIKGNEMMKKALAVSMFSSYTEPVHVLVLGDPGSSKSLAKDTITQNFKEITLVGANTTRSGLVCNLGSGDLGALAYSDQKLVLVDEFDKIPKADVQYCYELLSNGICSVHSAKIHLDIESRFIMIALANPKTKIFSDRPIENIGLSPILMSRFALIVKTENLEKDDRIALFKKKFYGEAEIKKMPEHYDQWVKLARLHEPEVNASEWRVNEYLEKSDKIYQEHYTTSLRRDLRMGDYAKRIPMAIARAEFSDVTDEVIEKAEEIIIESVGDWE